MALDYLPSPGWAVIYGETPSASRWSELGENDDALATGAGIDDNAIIKRHMAAASVDIDNIDLANMDGVIQYTGATSNNNSSNYVMVQGAPTLKAGQWYLVIAATQMSRSGDSGTVFEHRLQVDGTTIATERIQSDVQRGDTIIGLYRSPTAGAKTVRVISVRLAGTLTFNVEAPRIEIVPLLFAS